MATEENPHAGQGPVVLDIGGDIGALIVEMPAQMEDLEVEIIPTGTDTRPVGRHHHAHDHPHGDVDHHDHADDDTHGHSHSHGPDGEHTRAGGAPPHVAVVARPTPDGRTIHSLVYPELVEGTYDLYVRPDGPIRLTASVLGGRVTDARWPNGSDS